VVIHVQESAGGMIVAIAHVGTRVFVSQGPPLSAQDDWIKKVCVEEAVEYNVRFASMQRKRNEDRGSVAAVLAPCEQKRADLSQPGFVLDLEWPDESKGLRNHEQLSDGYSTHASSDVPETRRSGT
jgi:hypothetical protein